MTEVHAISANVSGQVHGVGFRYTTQSVAKELGLTGWVRNNRDGTVSVWAQGPPTELQRLAVFLKTGPRAARVSSTEIIEATPDQTLTGFQVRY